MRLQCVIIGCLILSLAGCMNITASLEQDDLSVREIREASDCVPIVLGLAYGRASLEGALAEEVGIIGSVKVSPPQKAAIVPRQKITKIRRVQLHDYQFLFFGARCVEVIGE